MLARNFVRSLLFGHYPPKFAILWRRSIDQQRGRVVLVVAILIPPTPTDIPDREGSCFGCDFCKLV
jgi:hypothetical protein